MVNDDDVEDDGRKVDYKIRHFGRISDLHNTGLRKRKGGSGQVYLNKANPKKANLEM